MIRHLSILTPQSRVVTHLELTNRHCEALMDLTSQSLTIPEYLKENGSNYVKETQDILLALQKCFWKGSTTMSTRYVCQKCGKKFQGPKRGLQGVQDHIRMKHRGVGTWKKEQFDTGHGPHEDSTASLMIDAEIAQACGEPVDDWIKDMMP